jgi:hypothetical protein
MLEVQERFTGWMEMKIEMEIKEDAQRIFDPLLWPTGEFTFLNWRSTGYVPLNSTSKTSASRKRIYC